MWCTSRRHSGKNNHKYDAILTGKFFRSRAEAIAIFPMHLAVLPDLAPIIRAKNEAVAWNYTLKVTQHFTHTRDNSRGISSDISRNHLLEESIDLSLDKSRGIFIKTLHDISTPDGMHISCDHLIKNPITIARQIGTRLMVYFQVKIRK